MCGLRTLFCSGTHVVTNLSMGALGTMISTFLITPCQGTANLMPSQLRTPTPLPSPVGWGLWDFWAPSRLAKLDDIDTINAICLDIYSTMGQFGTPPQKWPSRGRPGSAPIPSQPPPTSRCPFHPKQTPKATPVFPSVRQLFSCNRRL
jgi:hypothetical protein